MGDMEGINMKTGKGVSEEVCVQVSIIRFVLFQNCRGNS